jgi:hypothetical protein
MSASLAPSPSASLDRPFAVPRMDALASKNGRTRSQRVAWALAGLAGALAWLGLRFWTSLETGPPICALRQVLHIGCPTCGFTRALASLAGGDAGVSLGQHPLALPIVLQLAAGWLMWGTGLVRDRSLIRGRWIARAAAANAAALLAVWIVRLALGTVPL